MKNKLKVLSTAVALSTVGISSATSVALINNNNSFTNETSQMINSSNQSITTNDLIPAQSNGQNANISTKSGPVTYWNDTITALDWYGNKIWSKDMSQLVKPPVNGYQGSWKRSWYNWDYNREENILWVLGYAFNSEQEVFGFDATTGNIKHQKKIGQKTGQVGQANQPYKFITALSSGNVMVYGDPVAGFNGEGTLYNPKTGDVTTFTGNSKDKVPDNKETGFAGKYKWYFFNLIPIANNMNIAEVVTYDKNSGTKDDQSAVNASYNVYGLLVDDKLNFIGGSQNVGSDFREPFKMSEGIQNYRNTTITPQRDYYTLLNKNTVTVTYNNVSLIDVSNTNNVKITQVKMTDSKWIQTWTVDSNDNLYFKFMKEGKVYRVNGESLKSTQSKFAPSTYLDLGGLDNQYVKPNANNFLIYNVYGYTGQLMMINAKYNDYINNNTNNIKPSDTDNEKLMYGLAIAVTPNKAQNVAGDLKGLLNTSGSFQQPADFKINDSVLTSKIPSEITKQDIEVMNDAFFKENDPKPFIITGIDDKTGAFEVTANLYKIPWFATYLPNDATPKVIKKTFDGKTSTDVNAKKITDKVSWKKLNSSTDYDFMNTLPTKIQQSDVDALDPFQASFQSQVITDGNGKQIYPKKTYTLSDQDDNKGTITVKVKYEYVPMNVSYSSENKYTFGDKELSEVKVLSYETSQQYEVFKKSTDPAFWFTGSSTKSTDNSNIDIDAKTVPQLKNLLTANTLPSSFDYLNTSSDTTNSALLPFVNTTNSKGYPISKMKFNVTSDDTNGTLKIEANMGTDYSPDGQSHKYSVTYKNLNTINSYKFNFNEKVPSIDNANIDTILASSVDQGNILKDFITYSGYDSNDFDIKLIPDDSTGKLTVQVNLNKNYAKAIGNSGHGFDNYTVTKTFDGFMTTPEYNNRFSVEFVSDDDSILSDLKGRQAQEILTAFGSDGKSGTGTLDINGTKYTNLKDFVEKLLVKSKGKSIPSEWSSNSNISVNVYVDNNLGMASFYIVIPKDQMNGATSDLNLVVTYSGFAKGNVDKTKDNFSFVSDKMLKNYLIKNKYITNDEWDKFTPDSFAKWLENNFDKIISYQTGEYVDKITNKKYTLTTVANTVQNNVTVTINFGSMTDELSLSEYSIQYNL